MTSVVHCSVVIPVYNASSFLEQTIRSVFDQTVEEIEVICVDDGSSDDSLSILNKVQEEAPIPFYILKKDGVGANSARNMGLSKARGEWIQFLDADDFLYPEKIENQIELGKKGDIVIGDYVVREDKGKEREVRTSIDQPWCALMTTYLGVTSSILWKRTILERVGAWSKDQKSSQEYELLFRCLDEGAKLTHSNHILTVKNDRGEKSISGRDLKGKWKRYLDLRRKALERAKEKEEVGAEEERCCEQAYFDALRMAHPYLSKDDFSHFKKKLPRNFSPHPTSTTSKSFLIFYRVFGIEGAERIRRITGKVLGK